MSTGETHYTYEPTAHGSFLVWTGSASDEEHRLETAIEAGDFEMARTVATDMESEAYATNFSRKLARAQLKAVTLPFFEVLARTSSPSPDSLITVSGQVYKDGTEILDMWTRARRSFLTSDVYDLRLHGEISGLISELSMLMLYARDAPNTGYLAVPSTFDEDYSRSLFEGKSNSFDLSVKHIDTPAERLKVQVKSTRRRQFEYAADIETIVVSDLTGSIAAAKYVLPAALIHDDQDMATKKENALLFRASTRLMDKTAEAFKK